MRTKVQLISFEQILLSLRDLHFDVQGLSEVANQIAGAVFVRKHGVGTVLAPQGKISRSAQSAPQHSALWIHHPGFLLGGEIATLLDRGYQKFWKTKRLEIPATADSLKAVHRFAEEVREIIGEPSLYNESLGSTSDSHMYDRLQGRDLPIAERSKRPGN